MCNVVITNYRLYYLHMYNFHKVKKMFKCIITSCKKTFTESLTFQKHVLKHNQKSKFFCCWCDAIFADVFEKRKHMLSAAHIKNARPIKSSSYYQVPFENYRCKICYTWFGLRHEFVKHMETDNHKYPCNECSINFLQPGERRYHIENHHEKIAHICEVCGGQFPDAKSVFRHLAVHKLVFECDFCKTCFSQKEHLYIHSESHSSGIPLHQLACPISGCGQILFKHVKKYSLFEHLRKHHKMLSGLRCRMCSKEFKDDFQLFQHWNIENDSITCKDGGVLTLITQRKTPQVKKTGSAKSQINASGRNIATTNLNGDVQPLTQKTTEEPIQLNMALIPSKTPTEINGNKQVIDENLQVLSIKEEPVEEPIQLGGTNTLGLEQSKKPAKISGNRRAIEMWEDKNLPVLTIKQEPIDESTQLAESRTLRLESTEINGKIRGLETSINNSLQIKQEPIEESIQLIDSRTLRLELSEKPSEICDDIRASETTSEKNLQVLTLKQEPAEESIELNEHTLSHLTMNQQTETIKQYQTEKCLVSDKDMQTAENTLDATIDLNKQILTPMGKAAEQSEVFKSPIKPILETTLERSLDMNHQDEAVIYPEENSFMHVIPAEMIQLACAGCLCMFESEDHFLDHVCTGEISDAASGRIVMVPEDGNIIAAAGVAPAAVSEQFF